ncbi:hypothetical protein AMK33_02660 [Streptomyces sp. CB02400]|nr:hypothetical protein AMK33_02660 [Streptomyces sp. CB02400]
MPQVAREGDRLIGRVLSEPDAETQAYALRQGSNVRYRLTGGLGFVGRHPVRGRPGYNHRGPWRVGDATMR